MPIFPPIEPIDYLIIGHITQDVTPDGYKPGGTVSFSGLTAKALGLRVGIVTSCSHGRDFSFLVDIPVISIDSEFDTTFENVNTPTGRIQYCYHTATTLNYSMIPDLWKSTPIVHLAPIANEIDPTIVRSLTDSLIVTTPQGFLRSWDSTGRVSFEDWPEMRFVLNKCSAAVLSIEDVQGNEDRIDEMASAISLLVVTEGAQGARVYWNGDVRRFTPPKMVEIEPTGAGDIFAAAFFHRYHQTRDPWEAGRFATHLAAFSVSRVGIESIPTASEIQSCLMEVL